MQNYAQVQFAQSFTKAATIKLSSSMHAFLPEDVQWNGDHAASIILLQCMLKTSSSCQWAA